MRPPAPREPAILLAVVLAAVTLSAIRPRALGTWLLEVAPILVAVPVFVATFRRFRFTALAYRLLAVAALLIALGAHYTYAEVPVGHWLRDLFGFERNHYDRIGHLVQGVTSAIVVRELLLRFNPLRPGRWLFAVVTASCLGISAAFELMEAVAGVLSGQAGTAYLATQGDAMDAQWDMACALAGAVTAQLLLGRIHEQQLPDRITGRVSG